MAQLIWNIPQERIDSFADNQKWTPTVMLNSGVMDENGQPIFIEKNNLTKEEILLNFFSNMLIEITNTHETVKAEEILRQSIVQLPKPVIISPPALTQEEIDAVGNP